MRRQELPNTAAYISHLAGSNILLVPIEIVARLLLALISVSLQVAMLRSKNLFAPHNWSIHFEF